MKIFGSRLLRVWLIALAALAVVSGANWWLSFWISKQAMELAREGVAVPDVMNTVASTAAGAAAVGGAIATITTAIIARYGAREATANLKPSNPPDHSK